MKISLQMWSLNEAKETSFQDKILKVGELGYDGIEYAGYGDMSAKDLKELVKKAGLKSYSTHVSYDIFKNSFDEELEYQKELGCEYIICPWADFKGGINDVMEICDVLNAAAEKAKAYGIKVGYHNHNHEFDKIDGKYILDLIGENTTDDVILEVDCFWAAYADVNPYEYIKKWGKKIELIHIKQIDAEKVNVDVEDGILDVNKIIEAAKYAKYFILEQEHFDKPVWDSITRNAEFLKKI
ncbi:MAG: sugar phosphate isomerase/epimerase [Oscillospiraceae bacterium]